MKLLIRHSLRPTLKGSIDPDGVNLSVQGKEKAILFGRQLDYPIRHCYSSYIQRCVDTIEYILLGTKQYKQITLKGCLSDDVFTYKKIASEYIKEKSLKKAVFNICFANHLPLGFKDLESCGKMLLDCLFEDLDDPHYIDIFCSHDYQLAILVTLMFNSNITVESITELWPEMLEGLYFHGFRNEFYCSWRNEKKRFVNFLM